MASAADQMKDKEMTGVMQIAKDKRAAIMKETEARMAEVEELDEFLRFGAALAPQSRQDDTQAIAAE